MAISDQQWLNWASQVLITEASAINNLVDSLNNDFIQACQLILNCQGRVIVIGMGKSGHIGRKIAATLASTGTPAFFVHPAEASHGDLGMITGNDLVIALSNSGFTQEIINILPIFKQLNIKIISLTGDLNSPLAKFADLSIHINVKTEACKLGLTPTTSTTATLAMGDALAMCLLQARGFTEEDFARSHPGGKLGKRLLLKVADIMRTGDDIPIIGENAKLTDAIIEISQKCLGMVAIAKKNTAEIIGIFTDGDLRRAFEKNVNLHDIQIKDIMNYNFKSINHDVLATKALDMMRQNKILALPVVDQVGNIIGAFNMHDLFKAGIV